MNPNTILEIPRDDAYEMPVLVKRLNSKAECRDIASFLVQRMGDALGALEIHVQLKQMAAIIDLALDKNKEAAIAKMIEKTTTVLGAHVERKGKAKVWEYDDGELAKLESRAEKVKSQISARKKFLQGLKRDVADTKTGEIIKHAILMSAGETIAVTLPE